jgi:signal transduction histidine kinase
MKNGASPMQVLPLRKRLWVRIYVALVTFTIVLAAIGLTAWEALNDFPILRTGAHAESVPHDHGPAPLHSHERTPKAMPTQGGDNGLSVPPPRDQPPLGRAKSGPPQGARMMALPVVMFLIIGLSILLVAYPVARWLARSIERLAAPVAAFGRGNLAARAPTDGPGEVGVLASQFNETADRIQALVRSQQSLLANASHELRSPLARIQMQLEQIGERSSIAIRADIRREIAELDDLVEEILLSSKLQSQHRPKLADTVELLALVAEEGARVGVQADGVLAVVRGDSRLLRRVIRNILENAVRYSGGNDSVEVRIARVGVNACVDVLDRGPGVPASERERIFEPFYRARGARETAGGVGLGLSLAKQIAREHGGTLECLEREGGGGHFRLTLPVISDHAETTQNRT